MNTNEITSGGIFVPDSAFAQCHASTLAALPGWRLIAAWTNRRRTILFWQGIIPA